jgi:copper binding protein CusF
VQATALGRITLALACACALACDSSCSDLGHADAVYRVRGEVVSQDGTGTDARIIIAHETIPSFKDRDGKRGQMPAMTMAFGMAPNVPAPTLTPGSRWQLTFEVRWSREPVLRITRVEPLAPGTELTLAAH